MGGASNASSLARFEDQRLITGAGRFVDDLALPGMLFACVVRSPHPHALIEALDVSEARSAPGVRAVLTWEDWRASGFKPLPCAQGLKRADGTPMNRPLYEPLAHDRVRWVGDPVAMVVADSPALAQDAAERVAVAYRPLPAVTSVLAAIEPGAPRVWDECSDNICFQHHLGDAEAVSSGFAKAAHVVRQTFRISRVTAATMEPRSCIGVYEADTGRYILHGMPQRPHPFRTQLAQVLAVAPEMVRVIAKDIGGSFGMKSPVYNEIPLVLLASRLTGRPVKWTSTRSEAFVSDAHGRDSVYEAELALDDEARFLAFRVKSTVNLGAYLQAASDTSATSNLGGLAGMYTTPAIQVDVTTAFTHTNPLRPYRGNGRPEASYVIERIIDIAAHELDLSPAEIRRRNLIPATAMPFKTGLIFTYDCGDFPRSFAMAMAAADLDGFERRRTEALARGKYRGLGIAAVIEQAAIPGFEAADIRFDGAGRATLFCGSMSQGQGHETIFPRLMAERLGLAAEDIVYVAGDTDLVLRGEGTGSSRSATTGGSAVLRATEGIIEKGRGIAADLLSVSPDEVAFADGIFSAKGTNRTVSLPDLARAAFARDGGEGLSASAIYEARQSNFPNGIHVCEVEIDERTGVTRLIAYNVVDDVGNALSSLMVEGQLVGGIAQGLGQALIEEIRFDPESGQLLTGSFMDYGMPRADDICAIHSESNAVPTNSNPLGVKGAGESGCVGGMAAVANAIVNALRPFGIKHLEMPMTAERVWRAMRDASAR
jgi:carbon-monoxide dehydrogenase large subunit